jgi:hypothetical protein
LIKFFGRPAIPTPPVCDARTLCAACGHRPNILFNIGYFAPRRRSKMCIEDGAIVLAPPMYGAVLGNTAQCHPVVIDVWVALRVEEALPQGPAIVDYPRRQKDL